MVAPHLTPALDSLGQAQQAPVTLVARKSCQLAPIYSKQCLITLRTEKKALPSIASPPPPLLGPQDFCAPLFVPGPSFSRRKGHHNPIHLSLVPYSLLEGTDKHPSKWHRPPPPPPAYICARGEGNVLVRHNGIHPQKHQVISSHMPRAWETTFRPSSWDLALQI